MPQGGTRPAWFTAFAAMFLCALAGLVAFPASAQDFPTLTGRVTDAASIIPPDVEDRLTQKLDALETQSQRQLVVATVSDLGGYDIADYGYRLGREWGIGDKDRNDGALLIIAPNERKVRIEVGYGLEPVLTDGLSWQIINTQIIPRFKQGDMPGGIEAGADAIIVQLTLPPEEAQRIAAAAQQSQSEGENSIIPLLFFGFFVFIFFVLPVFRTITGSARRYHGSSSSPIIWSSGGSGFGGSSGGFSGGFSGGGGSFGGGGASGGW